MDLRPRAQPGDAARLKRRFGAFWMGGPLSATEQACLNTFLAAGEEVTLFCYDPISGAPPGVQIAAASDVVDRSWTDAFTYRGVPDLAHFSDYFRYRMIRDHGLVWIDTDIVLLDAGRLPDGPADLVGREKDQGVNGAVLFFKDDAIVDSLIRETEAKAGKPLAWGATGPRLLTRTLSAGDRAGTALDHRVLYPIDHTDIWKTLLPEFREECEVLCQQAATLHLFNNIMVRLGYWKCMAPPVGSYLHERFRDSDSLGFFSDTYPAAVMRRLLHNFRASQSGQDLGFKSVLREFIPSLLRSYAHHRQVRGGA